MDIRKRLQGSRYFSRLLFFLSTLISIVILAVSYILYVQFVGIEEKRTFDYAEESLSQISTTADAMLENAKMAISQVLLDKDIPKIFYQNQLDAVEMKTVSDRISLIASMPFLHSVYLYNEKLDMFYTNTTGLLPGSFFSDPGITQLLKNFDPANNLKPYTRVIPHTTEFANMDHNVYTFIYFERLGPGSSYAIVLNISDSWMKKAITSMDKKKNGSIIIMDNNGVLVSSVYHDQILSDVSRQAFAQRILQSQKSSDHFIGDVDGVKSLVTFNSSNSLGWKFVRYTPYNDAVHEVEAMKKRTIAISIILLLIGLSLSYGSSRILNRPIADMSKLLVQQHKAINESSNTIKQEFLRKWLNSEQHLSLQDSTPLYANLRIALNRSEPIQLMLFRIDGFKAFTSQYSFKDRSLLRFAMMNIATELLSPYDACEAVDAGDDHIVLILQGFGAGNLAGIVREIQHNIRTHLKFSVTTVLSSPLTARIAGVRDLYMETLAASQYRLFAGWGSVIDFAEAKDLDVRQLRYPLHKEEQLTDALMLGHMEDVRSICMTMLDTMEGYSYKSFHLTVFRLFFAIHMVVDTLEKASGYEFDIPFHDLFAHLSEQERLADMKEAFAALFDRIEDKLGEKKNAKYDELIRIITQMIAAQYMREDLSLDTIAEALNMSPVYLGRLIKKYTSKTLTDFINEYRMEKAQELLRETDKLIVVIAEETGFASNSYFGKVFKKYQGITPNEYRLRTRNAAQ
ncbi:AraC family transcriptional regulator [Paenibacillus qinlingensis]|uniref:AraC family transcriptional regulator n=1 Tax=Paenibacillus qinlingensis TaxID=1837343 RepID=UPI0015672551|nr:helix-turn-helix domain-containing protein [Paenibacillus qinlingensis]NQX58112.1 helix-turn-helix domain-containing protein [Paenibacillus qinlingensis]